MSARVIHGDCIEEMRAMPDASIDAIVTDPPYGLGFMGKTWDDLPPGEEWARECLRVLKPGGHLLAFGGTRTWHRLAVAVEDAGFEIRDSIAWLYGSGFPKSLDVSKAIDKVAPRAGLFAAFAAHFWERWQASGMTRRDFVPHFPHYKNAESVMAQLSNWKLAKNVPSRQDFAILRDLIGLSDEWQVLIDRVEAEREVIGTRAGNRLAVAPGQGMDRSAIDLDVTAPATPDAERWQGWGTALKPAFEPIVVGRKPLAGTVAANVLAHGTGALNIDGCRVGAQESGRWPANVVLDDTQAAELDRQSGITRSNVRQPTGRDDRGIPNGDGNVVVRRNDTQARGIADQGGASRFFPVFPNPEEETSCAAPTEHATTRTATGAAGATPAPSTTARSAPVAGESGGTTDLPTFKYQAKAPASERPKVDGVSHPTVKPLALMRWLVRLVTPPGGVVLDPFAGSGTTIEAALLEGFDVIGIEREAEYLPLIDQRIARASA